MLERTVAPEFGKISSIDLVEPKLNHLDNGIPVFSIDAGTQQVLKVQLIFPAGTASASKTLVASFSAKLLTEGTSSKTAAEIAQAVDFYGAHLQTDIKHDEISLDLFTLNKHLKNTLTTLAEVYTDSTFPEKEFKTMCLNAQQEMMVNEAKVSYLGSKAFSAALFGAKNAYGRSADIADYDNISRDDALDFYNQHIRQNIKHIIVSGSLTDDTITELNRHFGKEKRTERTVKSYVLDSESEKNVHIEKADAVQNVIRIGRVLFNRTHSDFVGMQILSTVLGGYFGSRLMANIREDKGYTYGIGAGLASFKNSGYLFISTEVGSDVCTAALTEIYLEIEKLRNQLIPEQELELVRNYLLGSILKSVDGPFAIASKWKTYLQYDMSIASHRDLIHQIKTITPERLKELAEQYFQKEDLVQVTVGKPL